MESNNFIYNNLKFVSFSELTNWDTKNINRNFLKLFNSKYPIVVFGEFLSKVEINKIKIDDNKTYKILGVRSYGNGVYLNRVVKGVTLKMRIYQKAKVNHLFWCKVDTKNGAFGVITKDYKNSIASSNMTFAKINTAKADTKYIQLLFKSNKINSYLDSYVTGTTNRKYILIDQLLSEIKIPLPSLEEQNRLVNSYTKKIKAAEEQEQEAGQLEHEIENYLLEELGVEKQMEEKKQPGKLIFVHFKDIKEWGIDKISNRTFNLFNSHYEIVSLSNSSNLYIDVFRGKSPKYSENSTKYILNQKCNRWNSIEIEHARKVDDSWINSVKDIFLTKEHDILINSTGEGTIGRASYINKNFSGLLYDSHILLLRLNNKLIDSLYFIYFFNSLLGQEQVNEIKSAQSTKQTELGINNLLKINFPLPPLEKQKEIVAYITNLKNKIKKLHILAKKNREEAIQEFEQEIFNS